MLANSYGLWFDQMNRLAHRVKSLVGCLLGVCGLLVAMDSWSSAQSLDQKAELESVSQKPTQGAALDSKPGDKPPKEDPEKWNVKLGGHVQMDYVLWANAPESIPNANNYFNFRRLRLVADGTGYDV